MSRLKPTISQHSALSFTLANFFANTGDSREPWATILPQQTSKCSEDQWQIADHLLIRTRPIQGRIGWLPPREELGSDTGLPVKCHNHPVVILSREPANGSVVILIVGCSISVHKCSVLTNSDNFIRRDGSTGEV
jgi:hypothetical protein